MDLELNKIYNQDCLEGMQKMEKTKYRDKNWLYKQYVKLERSITDIAQELEVDHTTISKWRRKLNIPKPSKKVELICDVCGKKFKRNRSKIKSKNVFCSSECKAKGMEQGLVADIRKGTGCSEKIKYYKRKYYKYRQRDKKNGRKMPDYDVWDLVERLKNGKCIYCGTKENLGLDRINNDKGHTVENTVISCERCNMTRGRRFTVEQMKKIGEVIKSFD